MKCIFILTLSLLPLLLSTQNLVYNGSFEKYSKLPYNYDQVEFCKGWSAGISSPDYFHENYDTTKTTDYSYIYESPYLAFLRIPKNDFGNQIARTGQAYLGGFIHKYPEIIQTKLIKPLEKNHYYKLEFYVSLAEESKFATNNIGAKFLYKELVWSNDYRKIKKMKPDVVNPSTNKLNSVDEWMKISGIYKAQGGEEYLAIGYFGPFDLKNWTKKNGWKILNKWRIIQAYYYYDDVSLYEVDSLGNMITHDTVQVAVQDTIIKNLDTLEVGQAFVLKKISFDYNKSELLPSSFEFLDELADYLQEKPTVKIEINGYTDNTGSEEANKLLSTNRAKSVFEYLISVGILSERMKYQGFGSANPIADNSTEQGRTKNRRVEVKVVER